MGLKQILVDLFVVVSLGGVSGFLVARGTQLLDFMLDYGHYLGWLRLRAARHYARKSALEEELNDYLQEAKNSDDPISLMNGIYLKIADHNKMFKRWICIVCLSTFLSLFVALMMIFLWVTYYSFPFWNPILWLSVISVFCFNYHFVR